MLVCLEHSNGKDLVSVGSNGSVQHVPFRNHENAEQTHPSELLTPVDTGCVFIKRFINQSMESHFILSPLVNPSIALAFGKAKTAEHLKLVHPIQNGEHFIDDAGSLLNLRFNLYTGHKVHPLVNIPAHDAQRASASLAHDARVMGAAVRAAHERERRFRDAGPSSGVPSSSAPEPRLDALVRENAQLHDRFEQALHSLHSAGMHSCAESLKSSLTFKGSKQQQSGTAIRCNQVHPSPPHERHTQHARATHPSTADAADDELEDVRIVAQYDGYQVGSTTPPSRKKSQLETLERDSKSSSRLHSPVRQLDMNIDADKHQHQHHDVQELHGTPSPFGESQREHKKRTPVSDPQRMQHEHHVKLHPIDWQSEAAAIASNNLHHAFHEIRLSDDENKSHR